jgi:type II secretion system protein I
MKTQAAHKNKKGFTLLEVLLATAIFAFAILAIVSAQTSSRNNIGKSQKIFQAVQLAQSKMVELELKYQASIDKNGVEHSFATEEGVFEAPNQDFSWKAEFKESSLKLSADELTQVLKGLGLDEDMIAAQLEQQKLVFTNLNKAIKENFGELVVTILWKSYGAQERFPLVTHLIPSKPKIQLTMDADLSGGS